MKMVARTPGPRFSGRVALAGLHGCVIFASTSAAIVIMTLVDPAACTSRAVMTISSGDRFVTCSS